MTDDELKTIEARANAATEGPWQADGDAECILHVRAANGHTVVTTDCGIYTTDEDAVFIAHARTDVPALAAEVRRLREARLLAREMRCAVDQMRCSSAHASGCHIDADSRRSLGPDWRCPTCAVYAALVEPA